MKYIFLGYTNFSAEVLFHLTDNKFWPEAIFTIPKEFQISYSDDKVKNTNFFDFKAVSLLNSIPIYTVDSSLNKSISDY
jgi:methionyl-tRNA formyltransferase